MADRLLLLDFVPRLLLSLVLAPVGLGLFHLVVIIILVFLVSKVLHAVAADEVQGTLALGEGRV